MSNTLQCWPSFLAVAAKKSANVLRIDLAIRVKELALTFGTGRTPDHLWMSSNIINDWSLDSRDLKVPSFSKNCLTNTTEGIELEGSVTRFNFKTKHRQISH